MITDQLEDVELEKRAFRAYFRNAKREGIYSPAIPSGGSSQVETYEGQRYVVLRNVRGILDIYKLRTDGKLQRVLYTEWPEELEERE